MRSNNEMKAKVIWRGPEIAMITYVHKSCSRMASTDIRLIVSPVDLLRSSLERIKALEKMAVTRPARTRMLLNV